jgi:hypothetical protein
MSVSDEIRYTCCFGPIKTPTPTCCLGSREISENHLMVLHLNAISDERKDKPTFIYPKLALEIKFLNLIKTPSYLGK